MAIQIYSADDVLNIDNRFNDLDFSFLNVPDNRLLILALRSLRNQEGSMITVTYEEIRKNIESYKKRSNAEIWQDLKELSEKMMGSSINLMTDEEGFDYIHIFDECRSVKGSNTWEIQLSQKYTYLVNNIFNYYPIVMKDFFALKKVVSQNLLKLLAQWYSHGTYIVGPGGKIRTFDEFRHRLGIKDTYENKHVMQFIKRAVDEINELKSDFITNLHYEIKKENRRGAPVEGIIFYWDSPIAREKLEKRKEKKKKDDTWSPMHLTIMNTFKSCGVSLHPDTVVKMVMVCEQYNLDNKEIERRIKEVFDRNPEIEDYEAYFNKIIFTNKYQRPANQYKSLSQSQNYDFDALKKLISDVVDSTKFD